MDDRSKELDFLIPEDEESSDEMQGKYLTFWTENQEFAVPICDVVQIIGIQDITSIPDFPSYAKGVIHLRGSVVPIIDVRLRFGKEEAPYTDHTCIIVTSIGGALIGFVVDSVDEVTAIDDDQISPPPRLSGEAVNAYLTGVASHKDRLILLLDTQRMISDEHMSMLTQVI